jgi:hypothetical protein
MEVGEQVVGAADRKRVSGGELAALGVHVRVQVSELVEARADDDEVNLGLVTLRELLHGPARRPGDRHAKCRRRPGLKVAFCPDG